MKKKRLSVRPSKVIHLSECKPQLVKVGQPPILANIYLHYTLDIWFEKRIKRKSLGYSRLIHYADDYVVCFENQLNANDIVQIMIPRLKKFHLEISPERIKLFEFGNFAQLKAKSKGTKAVTFYFLGFTH
ncbi:MAG: hypothetical protein JKX98_08070 [Alcanivoracaceae bacterium]|nr:hypothetical protein [Alcanivoracaceae bacterium]